MLKTFLLNVLTTAQHSKLFQFLMLKAFLLGVLTTFLNFVLTRKEVLNKANLTIKKLINFMEKTV